MKIAGLLLTLHIALMPFSYAAILADTQAIYREDTAAAAKACRKNIGTSIFFSMFPVAGELIAGLGTGFFEHGFKWRCP